MQRYFHPKRKQWRIEISRLSAIGGFLLLVFGGASSFGESAATPSVDYDRQIRPILSDKCFRCHGPDAESREAGLRLDRADGIPDYVIVPGKPDESELVARITSDDDEMRMPPPASNLKLSTEEKALLAKWI